MKSKMIVGFLGILMFSSLVGAATVAQFNFDSLSADRKTVTDISGNSHNAIFNREVYLYTDDPFRLRGLNYSPRLNPSLGTTMAYLANPGTINLSGNQFTLEGWIKPTSGTSSQTLLQIIAGSYNYFVGLIYDSQTMSIKPTARMYVDQWYRATGDALPVNEWTHLAAVYNGPVGGYLRLYVNGVEAANIYVGKSLATPTSVFFGGGGNLGQVDGYIDDLRISNSALAPSEFGYHQSFTAPVPPAIAKFNFDTRSPNLKRFLDVSYNNHDAVFTYDYAHTSTDDPYNKDSSRSVYVNEYESGILAFLDNPSTINLNVRNQFTMECWFKPEHLYSSTLIQAYQGSGGAFNAVLGMMQNTGLVQARLYAGGEWFSIDGSCLAVGTWYHLAFTYDGGTLHLYVNGQENGSVFAGKALPTSLSYVVIGGGGNYGNSDGWFDDVAIYDWAKEAGDLENVPSFTPETVYADEYGFTADDATNALQKAIDSGARTVIVRNKNSPWYVAKTIAINNRSYLTLNF
ncbi:MAG: LamG domain-containing protein, partial [Phycisphaerae bacterium]|nr:LamG domain-containing protein [Phycisphaerae bacterium]